MIFKALLTLGILVYAVLVPVLEISSTHVFNPNWPAHALLHEVWQLITNSMLGLYCLWLIWMKEKVVLPSLIGMLVTGGFLVAYLLKGLYGGSMVHTDGSEISLLGMNAGMNAGVMVFGLVFMGYAAALLIAYKKQTVQLQRAS